jgi:tetratricopeptide (TPR) repeat protein
MGRIEKTVFISYRRTNLPWALFIYQNLTMHGYDVFFDYLSIDSGNFEKVILDNIRARAHFLVILTPSALERCKESADWLRREIETAIDEKRNIVPLMMESFDFGSSLVKEVLTGKLASLDSYNGLRVPSDYALEAMDRLRDRYLNFPLSDVSLPELKAEIQEITAIQKEAAKEAPPVEEEQLTAQEWLERGYLFGEEGNFDEAIRCYTEALNLAPNDHFVHSLRGSAYRGLGDLIKALADINDAIRIDPNFSESYSLRGEIHREMGDLVKAIFDHNEAIRLKPDSAPAYELRGMAHEDEGNLDSAIADYTEAIHLKPDFAEAFTNRGSARSSKGNLVEAIKDYTEAIRLRPDHSDAYHNRGNARGNKGDLDGAIKDYTEAIRLRPDYVSAYYNRAIAWEEKEEYHLAIADYQKYLDLCGGIINGNQEEVEDLIRNLEKKIK